MNIFFSDLFGQSTSRDSLLLLLKSSKEDTNKVNLYFELSQLFTFNAPDEAQIYIEKALDLSRKINYPRAIILCYDKLGGLAMVNSDFESALYYLKKADSLLQYENWPREQAIIYGNLAALYGDYGYVDSAIVWNERFIALAESMNNEGFIAYGKLVMGDIYHDKRQNELAARYFIDAVRIYEKLGIQDRMADALRVLGATQTSFQSFDDAEENLSKAIEIYKTLNDDYFLSQAYRDLGYNHFLQDENEQAEEKYFQALSLSEAMEDPFGIAQAYENLGEIAFEKATFDTARIYALKALELYEKIEDPISIGQINSQLARATLALKEYNSALSLNQKAEDILIEIEAFTALQQVYKNYHNIFDALNQPDSALIYYQKYSVISDSIFTVEKAIQLEELQLIYKVEKKDQEIALLSKDIALGKLRRQLLTFGILAITFIAGLFIYILIVRRNKERKIQEERNKRQVAELEKQTLEKEQLERELAAQVLQLCRKNELLASVQQEVANLSKPNAISDKTNFRKLERTIEVNIQSDDDWRQFLSTFEKVHPNFLSALRKKVVKLSPAEQRLACLFKMNLSSKEIATMLNISDEGVKKARYRLRKKLGLPSEINLQEYLINFSEELLAGS